MNKIKTVIRPCVLAALKNLQKSKPGEFLAAGILADICSTGLNELAVVLEDLDRSGYTETRWIGGVPASSRLKSSEDTPANR